MEDETACGFFRWVTPEDEQVIELGEFAQIEGTSFVSVYSVGRYRALGDSFKTLFSE